MQLSEWKHALVLAKSNKKLYNYLSLFLRWRSIILTLTKDNIIKNREAWLSAGFDLPVFDLDAVEQQTKAHPTWLHIGPGNIFRAFPALHVQQLINEGLHDTGIIACKTYDEESIKTAFTPYDNLTCVVTLLSDGEKKMAIAATLVEVLGLSSERARLTDVFISPSLQLVSFTITEKAYQTHDANGQVLPQIQQELNGNPDEVVSVPALVAALLNKRYQANAQPLALVSMDNCAYNGDLLKKSVIFVANAWLDRGIITKDLIDYLENSITFPITMIDKITPLPSQDISNHLKTMGYTDFEIKTTAKNTPVATFVNAEETGYLVIEDLFPNGKPPLEKCGIIFTDRETVVNIEKMKVGACLNPLHTIIAIFGSLLGYTSVSQSMKNEGLVKLIKTAGYTEALPHVPDPGVISPQDFIDTVINKRFPNPFIPDTPQRIATDTSLKIPVRFGEVLKTMRSKGSDLLQLVAIPFFIAGWFRYLMQINDEGQKFELSPDPMLHELIPIFSAYQLGQNNLFNPKTIELLQNKAIFGIDLVACGLATKIQAYFDLLTEKPGAIHQALEKFAKQSQGDSL